MSRWAGALNDPDKVEDEIVRRTAINLRKQMQRLEQKLIEMELIPIKYKFSHEGEEMLLTPAEYGRW